MDRSFTGSEGRLWELIDERSSPGADRAKIDARIWELFGEDWAIMMTDLEGFSRSTEKFGIIHFLQIIHESHKLLVPVVDDHVGIIIKTEADNFMVLFRHISSALECAIAMQRACHQANLHRADEDKVLLCVGLGWGRVLRIGDHDVWGSEVNASSKLGEDTAEADEILVTGLARAALADFADVTFTKLEVGVPGSAENYRVDYAR